MDLKLQMLVATLIVLVLLYFLTLREDSFTKTGETISLVLDKGVGKVTFENICKFRTSKTSWFKVSIEDINLKGEPVVRLNGVASLDGERIPLPCIYSNHPDGCFRVQVVIPGYDDFMRLETGTYNVNLELSWEAVREGEIEITIRCIVRDT